MANTSFTTRQMANTDEMTTEGAVHDKPGQENEAAREVYLSVTKSQE